MKQSGKTLYAGIGDSLCTGKVGVVPYPETQRTKGLQARKAYGETMR